MMKRCSKTVVKVKTDEGGVKITLRSGLGEEAQVGKRKTEVVGVEIV